MKVQRIRFRQKRTRRALQWVIIILGWNGGNNNSWKCEENQTQTKNKETPKPLLKLSESFTCLVCLIPFSNFLAKIRRAFSFTTLPPKNRHENSFVCFLNMWTILVTIVQNKIHDPFLSHNLWHQVLSWRKKNYVLEVTQFGRLCQLLNRVGIFNRQKPVR